MMMHSVDEKFKNNLDNSIWHSFMLDVHMCSEIRSLGNMLRSSLWNSLENSLWNSLVHSLNQTAQSTQRVKETNDA